MLLLKRVDFMIITQDKNNSIILGDLVVNDYEGLKEIRDYFMQYRLDNGNYSHFIQDSRTSFRSILPTDYIRKGNFLVHNQIISSDYNDLNSSDECDYYVERFKSNYLNTILIATSLLGHLDASEVDYMTKQFIATGIIKCLPIDDIWIKCSSELCKRKVNLNDYKVFLGLLKLNLISYQVQDIISVSEQNSGKLRHIYRDDLKNLVVNSHLLLGKNSANFKNKQLKR